MKLKMYQVDAFTDKLFTKVEETLGLKKFTMKVCIMDEETSEIRIEKTSSTPQNPMIAVMDGMKKAEVDLNNVEMISDVFNFTPKSP